MQVEGSKRWRLYYPTTELPDEYSPDFSPEEVEGLKLHSEVLLEQGDLLYFPRGWIHQAVTGDSASHHVTLSTYQKHHFGQLLKMAFDRALESAFAKNASLRQGLPPGVGSRFGSFAPESAEQDAFDSRVADLMTSVLDNLDVSGAVDALNVPFLLSRLPPAEELQGEAGEERLEQEDEIRFQLMAQMEMEDDDLEEADALSAGSDEAGGDGAEMGAMEGFADAGEHEVHDAQDAQPDDNDDDDDGNDDDDDDEEEGSDGEELAELRAMLSDEGAKIKMVPPTCLTWTLEEARISLCQISFVVCVLKGSIKEMDGTPTLTGIYSLSNFVTTHMNSTAAEVCGCFLLVLVVLSFNLFSVQLRDIIPSNITLPYEYTDAVKYLARNHASFVSVDSVPASSAEEREKLLLALHTAGLIKLKKPGFSAD